LQRSDARSDLRLARCDGRSDDEAGKAEIRPHRKSPAGPYRADAFAGGRRLHEDIAESYCALSGTWASACGTEADGADIPRGALPGVPRYRPKPSRRDAAGIRQDGSGTRPGRAAARKSNRVIYGV